jgi:poly(A) polymerase
VKDLKNNRIIDTVIKTANQTGISAFLVGGAVRDFIRNDFNHNDLDFVVSDSLDLFVEEFSKIVKGKIIVWSENDRRVVFRMNGKNIQVDFALCKGETIDDDLKFRDITINAMAIDVNFIEENFLDHLIDPLKGIEDIQGEKIRICTDSAFINDPVRILRVLRFAAKYGYRIDETTCNLMKDSASLIDTVAVERVKKEFFSVLNYNNQRSSIEKMIDIGLMECLLPEIIEFKNIKQGSRHQYDLFNHSLQTVAMLERAEDELNKQFEAKADLLNQNLDELVEEGVTRRSLLVFAALFHDSGKTQTAESKGDRITFIRHEKEGKDINRNLVKRMGLGKNAQNIVSELTKNHMRVLFLSFLEKLTVRAVKRFIFDTKYIFNEILILSVADAMATKDNADLDKIFKVIGEILNISKSLNDVNDIDPLLNGNDIMDIAGFNNTPMIGAILDELKALECSGQIETRDDAIKWLKKRVDIN